MMGTGGYSAILNNREVETLASKHRNWWEKLNTGTNDIVLTYEIYKFFNLVTTPTL